MTSVLLVDDQALIRSGLRSVLESADIEVVGEAGDGETALRMAWELMPDVVLMDLRMPRRDGVEATRDIRANAPLAGVRILVLTTFDGDREVIAALAAGADGFLGKSAEPDDLIAAVERTARGEAALSPRAARAIVTHIGSGKSAPAIDPALEELVKTLTPRERDLVAAAATGDDNQSIAERLFISPLTVKTHLNRAMSKLGARNRGQLVAIAYRSGITR
jgi:DNA-binding NarL/FixJ family response regulator